MYENFLPHLLKAKKKGISLADIIMNHNVKNVCIYGVGTIGKVVFEEIRESGLNIAGFIDKAALNYNNGYCGFPVVVPEEINSLSNIDAVIVTPYKEFYQIKSYIKLFSDCRVLSARDVLSEALSENEFIEFSDFLADSGVSLYLFNRPGIDMIDNPSLWEQALLNVRTYRNYIMQRDFFEYLYKDAGINDVVEYLTEIRKNIIVIGDNPQTECRYKDIQSPLVNIINGFRFIPERPDAFENTVYLFGDCSNQGEDDTRTLGNYLQKQLNERFGGRFGVSPYYNTIRDISFLFQKVNSLPLREGDIIIYVDLAFWNQDHNYRFFHNLNNIFCLDLMPDFSRPHDYGEVFIDCSHITFRGKELIASSIFNYISENGGFRCAETVDTPANLSPVITKLNADSREIGGLIEELRLYKEYLSENRVDSPGKKGAIVMNCNPFTNGHDYIIEKAAALVGLLYVFVVEEDRSVFPFSDRLELVKRGVSHLKNVKVLRSGKFIISTVTFEGYFDKERMPTTEIDASEDVRIFAEEIAPVLNISVRFAGNEPFCNVTRQYNKYMADILPEYGIGFEEIERGRHCEKPISASYVRSLLAHNNFEEIKTLVPETTYDYLVSGYLNKTGDAAESFGNIH